MHARTVTFQSEPDRLAEGVRLYQESVVPAATRQPGFQGALLLVDRAAGRAISITLWETEADLIAGESSGYYQAQIDTLTPIITTPPTRAVFEVATQTLIQPPSPAGGAATRRP